MLSVIPVDERERWDIFVRSFTNYDVYYLSGYVKAFQLHGDGEPILFYYEDENVRAINVVMKRDIAKDERFAGKLPVDTYFDFATPYGYGGWLIEGEKTDKLFDAYEEWCKENGVVSEFVRYHPVLENVAFSANRYDQTMLGNTVTLDLSLPETIWSGLTSKNRNMVRKAQKNGVHIYNGRYPEVYEIFRRIYDGTMDKDQADDYYYFSETFYQSILNDLPQEAQVFYAQIEDGTIIAASIMLAANGYLNYHLSGSLKEYQHLAPSNLLLYEAALWGCANGCKTLHLGGGVGSREDSLYQFKKAFYRGEPTRFGIGRKIFNQEVYDKLLSMRTSMPEGKYFPEYRG